MDPVCSMHVEEKTPFVSEYGEINIIYAQRDVKCLLIKSTKIYNEYILAKQQIIILVEWFVEYIMQLVSILNLNEN